MPAEVNPTSASLQAVEAAALQLLEAVRLVRGFSVSSQVVSLKNVSAPLTIADFFNAFLIAKARAGRSDNYTGLLLKELRSFATGREGRSVASITAHEIEQWLHGEGWSARTKRGRLLTLRNVLSWGCSRGELVCNVALGVDLPTDDSEEPPGIHTPKQVKLVLETARKLDLNTLRCMAVRYFAGLRRSEATALEEKEIGKDFIEVTARKAKTRRRRLVKIQPALRAWLELGGKLPLRQVANRLTDLSTATKALGIPQPRNAARHSFVSYHLAAFRSAAETALEAGHSEQMLFGHYREIVTPQEAAKFWALRPD
jgi:site-specific recombinase XerC